MTAVVFVLALTLAYLHWNLAEVGWLIAGTNITIYVAAFVATLAAAVTAALVSRYPRCLMAAAVLVLNFAGSHFAWQTDNPLIWGGVNDLVSAAWFVLAGDSRWEFGIGGLLLLSVLASVLATVGLIPDHLTRDNSWFIAWSYPDIVALLGHGANILLGLGAGDGGRMVRVPLESRPRLAAFRSGVFTRRRLGS